MEQIVAASVGGGGWHFRLGEYPFQTLNGQLAHVLHRIFPCHDDVHSCQTAHWTNIHNIVFYGRIAEPCGHQMFDAMHGGWRHSRFFVWQVYDSAQTKYDSVKAKQTNAENMIFSANSDKVADADLKVLKAMKDQAELNLGYTQIKAPRDGVVTNKNVEKGAYVQVGQPLFAIVPDEVWVVANFKESQVGNMKPGQPVDIKIDAYPKKVFKGKIDSIQRASGAKASLFPPENAVGSFVKIVQRIPVKIVFTEEIDSNKYTIVSGMSVIPKVRVK